MPDVRSPAEGTRPCRGQYGPAARQLRRRLRRYHSGHASALCLRGAPASECHGTPTCYRVTLPSNGLSKAYRGLPTSHSSHPTSHPTSLYILHPCTSHIPVHPTSLYIPHHIPHPSVRPELPAGGAVRDPLRLRVRVVVGHQCARHGPNLLHDLATCCCGCSRPEFGSSLEQSPSRCSSPLVSSAWRRLPSSASAHSPGQTGSRTSAVLCVPHPSCLTPRASSLL